MTVEENLLVPVVRMRQSLDDTTARVVRLLEDIGLFRSPLPKRL